MLNRSPFSLSLLAKHFHTLYTGKYGVIMGLTLRTMLLIERYLNSIAISLIC